MSGIRLRHLTFTGPHVAPAELLFFDGLNIIYGASNTGKSFTTKAILFMLGASKALPEIEQIVAYDQVWLGLVMPDGREVTLYRAARGGDLRIFEGLVSRAAADAGIMLREKHESKRTDTVSHLLLDALGLASKAIVRNTSGSKDALTINRLSAYMVVSEGDIIAEKSPVFTSGVPAQRTFEQNLFKLLVTGVDDSATVAVQTQSDRKVAKAAKIELVDEMITQVEAELGENAPAQIELEQQLGRLEQNARDLWADVQASQGALDGFVTERRTVMDRRNELQQRAGELDLTLQRFASLKAVYVSDLERLQSIEESGFVLVAMTGMDCPVCGAPADAQKHNHAAEEIAMAHTAAAAEVRKIEREQLELAQTTASLDAEFAGLGQTIEQLSETVGRLDESIRQTRPLEASLRNGHAALVTKRADVVRWLDLYQRRAELVVRREQLAKEPTSGKREAPQVGADATTAYRFGETIQAVLKAWHFPDADKVQFDTVSGDVTVAGKRRAANGKGVRAILRAAFNVAVIVYCIDNGLPHPGFLVLDTPLLTYREPLTSRHGQLSDDEAALAGSGLAEHFYSHLASLKAHVQFIVIENSTPPAAIGDFARITTFTHVADRGRFGLLAMGGSSV
ncbi:hypothetical protein AB7849_17415 [Rhodanobacter sp. 115]|uniref:hypothetical protein n=1 Tax=Rhodanobacter sp. FW021-MT20 TaxID=1162282 RepID=UPI000260DF7F|nr:hypothetical protein [Rhodanobacter sp. 115]EIL90898.1 hypothetical protein UU5_14548 [Rhodanobacter sp. 115]